MFKKYVYSFLLTFGCFSLYSMESAPEKEMTERYEWPVEIKGLCLYLENKDTMWFPGDTDTSLKDLKLISLAMNCVKKLDLDSLKSFFSFIGFNDSRIKTQKNVLLLKSYFINYLKDKRKNCEESLDTFERADFYLRSEPYAERRPLTISTKSAETEKLKETLSEKENEIINLKEQIERLKQALEKMADTTNDWEIENLQKTVAELQDALEQATDDQCDLTEKNTDLYERIEHLSKNFEDLEEQYRKKCSEHSALEKSHRDLLAKSQHQHRETPERGHLFSHLMGSIQGFLKSGCDEE